MVSNTSAETHDTYADGPATGLYYVHRDFSLPSSEDWLWFDPEGHPFVPTAIDKIEMHNLAHLPDWSTTYAAGDDDPWFEWAEDVRVLLRDAAINTIGRESHWDVTEGDDPGDTRDFDKIHCIENDQGNPEWVHPPVYDDYRFIKWQNQQAALHGEPEIPYLVTLHAVQIDVDGAFGTSNTSYGATPDIWSEGYTNRLEMLVELVLRDPEPGGNPEECVPGNPNPHAYQGLRSDPNLLGMWLGTELRWHYTRMLPKALEADAQGVHGRRFWLRNLLLLPYGDRDDHEQARYKFAEAMEEYYNYKVTIDPTADNAVHLWNLNYAFYPEVDDYLSPAFRPGTAPPGWDPPEYPNFGPFVPFSITSFTGDEETSLLNSFDARWLTDEYQEHTLEEWHLVYCGEGCADSGEGYWYIEGADDLETAPLIEPDPNDIEKTPYEVDLGALLLVDDAEYFIKILAEHFYTTFVDKIEEYDVQVGPENEGHVILSDRFLGTADELYPAVLAIASEFVDVMSFNVYTSSPSSLGSFFRPIYNQLPEPKPFFISEFSFHKDHARGWDCCFDEDLESPVTNCLAHGYDCQGQDKWHYPESFDAGTQASDFASYVSTTMQLKAMADLGKPHRFITGYNWYRFFDIQFEDDATITEHSQTWGLVDALAKADDRPYMVPYVTLSGYMENVNGQVQEAIMDRTFWPETVTSGSIVLNSGPPQ